jgi:protein-tyrosine-phosphatase
VEVTPVVRATMVVLAISASSAIAAAQTPAATAKASKQPTVLFMCPHGAAKSVLASAYFERFAKDRGLNVRVASAGTDPDPEVAASVARHLESRGYRVPVTKPRRVTPEDLKTADVVVSIGCDLTGLPAPAGTLRKWDDVPPPSEDFTRADDMIRERVLQLVDELVRKQPR